MKSSDRAGFERASSICNLLNSGYNLTHTLSMVKCLEDESLSEKEKQGELLRTVSELELIYKEHKNEKRLKYLQKSIEMTLDCARGDIEKKKDYWGAIMDISVLETITPLQKYLPKLPNIDNERYAHLLLIGKMVKSFGGTFEIKENEPEDPADWWKK